MNQAPLATPPPGDGDPKMTRILSPSGAAPGLPARIDKYVVDGILGSGGMGAVYLAHDPDLDRKVAIKLIRPELIGNNDYVDRMLREARLCARLNHPNIVVIHQVGRHEGAPYLVLEYVEGKSLLELLRSVPPLAIADSLDIIAQCCMGLQAAARKKIVHRDIKPANIMVSLHGEAKIMDFGLSKSVSPESMTASNMLLGTPDYMSPEQAQQKPVDHRADIYALGITLFHCVTGYLPFRAPSAMTTLMNHQTKPLPEDAGLKAIAGGRLWDLVYGMTAKDPADRLHSYDAIRTELIAIRDILRLESGGLTPVEMDSQASATTIDKRGLAPPSMRAGEKRRPRLLFPAILTLAFAGAAVAVYEFDLLPARASSQQPTPPVPAVVEPAEPAEDANAVVGGLNLRTRGSSGSLRDLIIGLQSNGINVVLDDGLNPAVYTASYHFEAAEPLSALRAAALGSNWSAREEDQIWYIGSNGKPSAELVAKDREGLNLAALPSVNLNTVGGGVKLREACEAFRRDAGIDYLIMPLELSESTLPPVGLTGAPLGQAMNLLQRQGAPIEWTMHEGVLLIVPKWE